MEGGFIENVKSNACKREEAFFSKYPGRLIYGAHVIKPFPGALKPLLQFEKVKDNWYYKNVSLNRFHLHLFFIRSNVNHVNQNIN